MTQTAMVWAAAAPFLLVVWLVQRIPGVRGIGGLLFAAMIGLGAVFNEWSGRWLPFWSAGLSANFSVTMAVLLAVAIGDRACGARIFRAREWRAAWIFGALAALVLYPSALGLGLRNFDTYALGWPWLEWVRSLWLFAPVAAAAGFLVRRGNRFGWILALAAVAYLLRVQESHNFWDYLLDPLYAVVSLLATAGMVVRSLRRR